MKAVGRADRRRRVVLSMVVALAALGLPALTATRSLAAFTPARVTVSHNPVYLLASTTATATVWATVRDSADNPVQNYPVAWGDNGGATFSPSTTLTDNTGMTSTTIKSDGTWGRSTITADTGTARGTATLIEYWSPAVLTLTLQPANILANATSTSLATLAVTDGHADPIPGLQVTMTRSGNATLGPVTDRGDGTYTAPITSSTTVGTQTITATEASSQLSTTAVLTQHGQGAVVGVTLSPPSVPATGTHTSTATAAVIDASGLAVPDEVVHFAGSGDATIGPVTNRGDGTYTATITSSQTPGPQTITATATNAGVSGSATLTQTFGALRTSGNQIVDAAGNPVVLEGVHRDGLEQRTQTYDPYNSAGNHVTAYPITDAEIQHAQQWGANVVRVPLSEDFWNQSCPTTPTSGNAAYRYDTNYRAEVGQVVQWITGRGMLALLDLHTTQTTTCDSQTRNQRLPLPDKVGATDFWRTVVPAFAANPLVAFELYNEPRVCSSQYGVGYPWGADQCDYTKTARATQLWNQGGPVQWKSEPPYTGAGMSDLYDAVQLAMPAGSPPHLIFVDGNNSATDPSVFSSTANPAMFKGANLVYAEHLYTCANLIGDPVDQGGGQKALDCENNPANGACSLVAPLIDSYQTPDVRQFPVVMDEFGWPNDSQSLYTQNVVSHLHAANRGFIGFAWDGSTPPPTTTDTWALLASNTPGPNDATASGQPLKNAMAGNYPSSC